MNREWFTAAEIKAARLPTLADDFIDFMESDAENLGAKARLRRSPYNKRMACAEIEFHVSLFMPAEQLHLVRTLCSGVFGRILKLGIHRKVADPRLIYQPRRAGKAA
jgi:hypothetical protein